MITRDIKVGDKIRWLNAGCEDKRTGGDVFKVTQVNMDERVVFDSNGRSWVSVFSHPGEFDIVDEPQADTVNHSGSKYLRDVQLIGSKIDVYAVLVAFGVSCPARQHAIKKLLCAGLRGKGDELQDLREAVDAVRRAIEIKEAAE
jgi:hypothetical protein